MKTEIELTEIKEALQAKFGKVYTLEVPLNEGEKTATMFLKKPGKETRSIVSTLVQKDPMRAVEAAIKNLYIGGDDLNMILADEDSVPSCEDAIVEMLTVQKAILKKN
jgi:hypothetical protein